MAAGRNLASDISGYVQTIYEDAWFVARDNNIMSRLVTNFTDSNQYSQTRTSSNYGSVTFATIGEDDDLSSQTFTPTTDQTLTPYEYGAQFFLTDARITDDPFGARNDAARELGLGIAKKMNNHLLGDFTSLTGGTVGGAGSTITWSYLAAAYSQLKNTKAPPPYYCVLHVYQYHRLASAASIANTTVGNAPEFTDEVTRQWYVGRVFGNLDLFVTTDITVDASDDAYGAMYSPSALALDMRRAPRMEVERDASRRGWELNLTSVYAHGVWRPAFGIQLHFDAAAPTS